jgi:predicted MFS family arabinose efflux permease
MAPRAPDRLLTRSFAALLVAQAGFGWAFSSYFLLPKFLVAELHAGPREAGLLTAAHNAAVVLLMPPMGALVDRFGRRRFLIAGALLMAAASLAFTTVDSFGPAIFTLRVLQALAFAMAFAAGSALAVDEAPPERVAQAIGFFGLTFLSMNAVGPVIVEAVSERAGWSAGFGLAAVGALACAVLSLRVRERAGVRSAEEPLSGLLGVATRPSQLRISAVIALVGAAFSSLFTFNQLFAFDSGIERLRDFFVAYAIGAIGVRVAFGASIDRFGRLRRRRAPRTGDSAHRTRAARRGARSRPRRLLSGVQRRRDRALRRERARQGDVALPGRLPGRRGDRRVRARAPRRERRLPAHLHRLRRLPRARARRARALAGGAAGAG